MPEASHHHIMDPLSKKLSFVRYSITLLAMCAIALGIRGLKPTSFIGFIIFAIVCLKYLFFDYLVRMTRHRWRRLRVLPWLWVGYLLAAMVDVAATWIAMRDTTGASLALAATVLIAPWFLVGALGLMAIHTYISERSHVKKMRLDP